VTPDKRRKTELRAVELLNVAEGIGLTELRNATADPPDVEGVLGARRVGIEVTFPIEEDELRTDTIFKRVVIPVVAKLAAAAAPGQAAIGLMNLTLRNRSEIVALSASLGEVCLALSAFAFAPGSHAAAAVGMFRQTLEDMGHWSIFDVPLPPGVESVLYTRLDSGPFHPFWSGSTGGAIFGAGLDVTEERIREKAAALPRWRDRYDERWLLIPVVWPSRTSVWQVKHDSTWFPNTGFDRIYITDSFRPVGVTDADLPVNVARLDDPF